MKPIIYLYLLLPCLCFACSDFLEESSQDLMIPKTVKDYKEFLYGEAIANGTAMHEYLDIMTDDVANLVRTRYFTSNDYREQVWAYFTWQSYPEIGVNNVMNADNAWEVYYHKILVTNVILAEIPDMEGTPEEITDLAAECHFLRAHSYFMLANLYGKPYIDAASAATDFCVPINNDATISDRMFTRSTVAEVYAHIESDLRAAITRFKSSRVEKTIYRPNLPAAYLLASRAALFQKDHERAIRLADSVLLHADGEICDLNTYPSAEYFFSSLNTELLFTHGNSTSTAFRADNMSRAVMVPEPGLLALYAAGDLRLKKFYTGSGYTKPNKWDSRTDVYFNAYRLSEAYLNRAEAYAETGNVEKALADLNTLRSCRFNTPSPVTAVTREEAIRAVRAERRLELAFEGFRWFDLRRWDRPRLVHRYSSLADPTLYDEHVLEANSISYTLPIPQKERDLNTAIERINRPESVKTN